ncbi:MAG TPA: methyltransferase domain-containing protein [Verrucomicrobiae bacterium]
MNLYESEQYLNEYLFFHYGDPKEFCPYRFAPKEALNFQRRLVRESLLPLRFPSPTRGLDVGCAVGRATFELARIVDQALGIDNSRSFISAARRMARKHSLKIQVKEVGEIFSKPTITLPKYLRDVRVKFRVGDAQDLRSFPRQKFHVVLAINLIDRLPNPARFFANLFALDLLVPGGQLVIASPYTWMEEYTPRSKWLGGIKHLEPHFIDGLLRPFFRLVRRCDLPFLIREHRRKYQWCVSEVSTYVRKGADAGTFA